MLKKYPLIQAVSDVKNTQLATAFTVSYTWYSYNRDGSVGLHNETILNTTIFDYLITHWPSWALVYDDSVAANNQWFARIFGGWRTRNTDNLARIATAYNSAYNPVDNYNSREQRTRLGNSGYIDSSTTHSVPQYTDSTTDSNTRTGSETRDDTASVTTFDSADLGVTDNNTGSTKYNSVTDSGSGSITHGEHTDTDTTTMTHHNALNGSADYSGGSDLFGNSVTGGDEYSNEIFTRAGNIGVTKTQEMIADELSLRTHDIVIEWLSGFISEYCILSPDVQDGDDEWY